MMGANRIISTQRLQKTNGKESYADGNIIIEQFVYIEQMSAEAAAMWNGENALLMNSMHAEGILDLKVSDRVTDDLGNQYTVKAVQFFSGGDIPNHTEAVIVKRQTYA